MRPFGVSFERSKWYMLTISSAVRVENYCNLENEHSNITTPQHRYASAQAGTSSCTVNCAPGYSGSGGTVTCDASTQDQDASFDNVQCTENECTLPDLDAVNLVLSSSCSTPLTTRTNSECTTECASRYYSTSASSTLTLIICFSSNWFNKILFVRTTGTGTVLCASDAQNGATASLVSTPNCAEISCVPFSLPTGT